MANGWFSTVFGIPSAIAVKLCLPDRVVACVTGDGGFLMMAGEMITARRLNLNYDRICALGEKLRGDMVWTEHTLAGVF